MNCIIYTYIFFLNKLLESDKKKKHHVIDCFTQCSFLNISWKKLKRSLHLTRFSNNLIVMDDFHLSIAYDGLSVYL